MKPRLQDLLSVQNWQQESSGDILYVAKVGACVGKWSLKKNSLYLIEFGLEDPYGKFFQIWETSLRLLGEADAGLLNCEPWPPVLCRTQGRCSWSSRRPESERTFKNWLRLRIGFGEISWRLKSFECRFVGAAVKTKKWISGCRKPAQLHFRSAQIPEIWLCLLPRVSQTYFQGSGD